MLNCFFKTTKYAALTFLFSALPLVAHAGTGARGSVNTGGHSYGNPVYSKPVYSKPVYGKPVYGKPIMTYSSAGQRDPNLDLASSLPRANHVHTNRSARAENRAYNPYSVHDRHDRNRNIIPGSFINGGYGYQPYPVYQSTNSGYLGDESYETGYAYPDHGSHSFVAAPKLIQIESVKARPPKTAAHSPKVVYGNSSIITRYEEAYTPNIVRVRVLKD